MSKSNYTFGPYPVLGRTITCDICGHKYIGTHCIYCETTHTPDESVKWTDEVTKKKRKKKKDDSGSV